MFIFAFFVNFVPSTGYASDWRTQLAIQQDINKTIWADLLANYYLDCIKVRCHALQIDFLFPQLQTVSEQLNELFMKHVTYFAHVEKTAGIVEELGKQVKKAQQNVKTLYECYEKLIKQYNSFNIFYGVLTEAGALKVLPSGEKNRIRGVCTEKAKEIDGFIAAWNRFSANATAFWGEIQELVDNQNYFNALLASDSRIHLTAKKEPEQLENFDEFKDKVMSQSFLFSTLQDMITAVGAIAESPSESPLWDADTDRELKELSEKASAKKLTTKVSAVTAIEALKKQVQALEIPKLTVADQQFIDSLSVYSDKDQFSRSAIVGQEKMFEVFNDKLIAPLKAIALYAPKELLSLQKQVNFVQEEIAFAQGIQDRLMEFARSKQLMARGARDEALISFFMSLIIDKLEHTKDTVDNIWAQLTAESQQKLTASGFKTLFDDAYNDISQEINDFKKKNQSDAKSNLKNLIYSTWYYQYYCELLQKIWQEGTFI